MEIGITGAVVDFDFLLDDLTALFGHGLFFCTGTGQFKELYARGAY